MNLRSYRGLYGFIPKRLRLKVTGLLSRVRAQLRRPGTRRRQERTLERIRGKKGPVRAAFLLMTPSVWKYDELYRLLEADGRFEPLVFICPWRVNEGGAVGDGAPAEATKAGMEECAAYCRAKGYRHQAAWTGERWTDLAGEIRPDLVFYTYPYSMTRKAYLQESLKDSLSCYVTYGFNVDGQEQRQFNLPFMNLMWRGYYETPMHLKLAAKHADNRGVNVRLGGSLLFDEMRRHAVAPGASCWTGGGRKRIIWAPHHTVDDLPNETHWCCFLQMAEPMLELARAHEADLEFVFKPHPKLYGKLLKHPDWGEARTKAYYEAWENLPNGHLQQGEYIDLFLQSDALILDCLSFMCEYMFTGKPSLFMLRRPDTVPRFNEFGEEVFRHLYHGSGMGAVEEFLRRTVLGGADEMKAERMAFFHETVDAVPGGASLGIVEDLRATLSGGGAE